MVVAVVLDDDDGLYVLVKVGTCRMSYAGGDTSQELLVRCLLEMPVASLRNAWCRLLSSSCTLCLSAAMRSRMVVVIELFTLWAVCEEALAGSMVDAARLLVDERGTGRFIQEIFGREILCDCFCFYELLCYEQPALQLQLARPVGSVRMEQ